MKNQSSTAEQGPRNGRSPSGHRGRDRVQSPLETYLREINRTPLLTAHQEKELARRIEDGDAGARDHMVRANLRLVVNIARDYTGKGILLQDLIEEGNLGLLRAVEGFDPSLNTRFSTYASYWVMQSIKRLIVNTAKTIRIPAYMVELLAKWRRTEVQLQELVGRTPTHDEIARRLEIPKNKITTIKKAILVYGTNYIGGHTHEGEEWTLGEILEDHRADEPDVEMIKSETKVQMHALLDELNKNEAAIIRLRFGLNGEEPFDRVKTGEIIGLSQERVRQIENKALQKLAVALGEDDAVEENADVKPVSKHTPKKTSSGKKNSRLWLQPQPARPYGTIST